MVESSPSSAATSTRSRSRLIAILVATTCGLLVALLAAGVVPLPGFGPQDLEDTLPDPIILGDATGNADLRQGLDFLNRLEQFDPQQIHPKVINHLQQWIDKQTPSPGWRPDPIAQQLDRNFAAMASPGRLASMMLEAYDLFVLQEATWLRDLATSLATQSNFDPLLSAQLARADAAPDVKLATKLFDWTVRNLQLDADVRPGDSHRFDCDVLLYAWESMLFGRGTMEEKARVFALLARQLRIPVVMLAVKTENGIRPWLPAAFLNQQLYLFDMQLGMPVPGPQDAGVATWSQVVADPSLLANLGSADTPYRIAADQLESVAVLIDATPAYLSRRMQLLEDALTGDDKMILTVAPSELAQNIADSTGIQNIGIWDLAYRSFGVRSQMSPESIGANSLYAAHRLLELTPLKLARVLNFRGQYERTDEEAGAISLYLDSRTSDEQIAALQQEGQKQPSADGPSEGISPQQAAQLAILMRRAKQDASYWLGLLAFERGQYQMSIDYLEKRLLNATPNTTWRDGAYYNLGRAFEALAATSRDARLRDRAAASYSHVTEGPTAASCQWRLRRLPPPSDVDPADAIDADDVKPLD